ncbi:PRC-barrel domain-containing protein [Trinickia sp. EG282A]|uniref:PRC-barrel domain-containing protein n=1 Tax=Trinickia sp. EG282A TaxID=3237013 RepID=UPI0034D20459
MRPGFQRPVAALYCLIALLVALLSGCSFTRVGPPAPIVEESVMLQPEVAASAPPPAEPVEGASTTEEAKAPAPKKPKHVIFHPRKPEEVTPPAPPPSPPPPPPAPVPKPLITTRLIDRASTRALLGTEVQKPDGKVVGRAVDMVADASGNPVQIVVNLQGFLGVGDRKASFPWSAIRVNPAAKTAPITINPVPDHPNSAPTPAELPIIDAIVQRPNGSEVGRVVDVFIDAAAHPQAVVLDVSSGIAPRHMIAVNWSALRFVTKEKALHAQTDMNEAQVNASPPYAADKPVQAVSPFIAAAPQPPPSPASPASLAGASEKAAAVASSPR